MQSCGSVFLLQPGIRTLSSTRSRNIDLNVRCTTSFTASCTCCTSVCHTRFHDVCAFHLLHSKLQLSSHAQAPAIRQLDHGSRIAVHSRRRGFSQRRRTETHTSEASESRSTIAQSSKTKLKRWCSPRALSSFHLRFLVAHVTCLHPLTDFPSAEIHRS